MALDENYAKQRVQSIRELVAGSPDERTDKLTPEDRNILIKFDESLTQDRKRNNRCGWLHHCNILTRLFVYAMETESLADSIQDGSEGSRALNQITDWIHEQDYSDHSLQGHMSTLRVFAEEVCDEMPEHYAEIEPSQWVDEDPTPLPSEIIDYEQAIEMAEEADMLRDKALILTQFGCGMRPMIALHPLQRKHVEIFDDHVKITLEREGKDDRRTIICIVGSALLRKWITEEHPVHDDPEAEMNPETYIWTDDKKNEWLTYSALAQRFTSAGEAAEINGDYSPQGFRRSAASNLAKRPYINERDLRHRFSWSRGSSAPEHYIQEFGQATQVNVVRCRGRAVENMDEIQEMPDIDTIPCPNCADYTTRGLDQCIHCDHNLEEEQLTIDNTVRDPRAAGERTLAQKLLDGDITADELRTIRKLEPHIKTKTDLFEELDDLIHKAQKLEESREETGGTVGAATGPTGVMAMLSEKVSEALTIQSKKVHAALSIDPEWQHYPPSKPRLAGIVLGWALILAVAIPIWLQNDIAQAAMAGEPTAIGAAVLSFGFGCYLCIRDIPTIDDALTRALEP